MSQFEQRHVVVALTIGLVVCIGCGTFLLLRPDRDSNVVEQNTTTPQDIVGNEDLLASMSPGARPQNESSTIQQSRSESLRENNNTFDSKHTLLSVVDNATEDKLIGMFIDSLENPMVFESISSTYWMQSVVLTKLVNIDINTTKSLLDQLSGRSAETVLYGVMCEWNRVHANEAIKLLASLDTDLKEQGFRGFVDGGNFISRAKLVEIGTAIGLEKEFVANLFDRQQTAPVQVSRKELEREFENIDLADHLILEQLSEKAANYILATGLDVLPEVLNLFDEFSAHNMSDADRFNMKASRTRVVSYVAKDDPEAVFDVVAPLATGADVNLLSAVAQVWFSVDPNALWNRLSESNLSGVKHEVTQDVIRYWSRIEPEVVLVSLNTVPSEYHDQVYLDVAEEMRNDSPFEALTLLPLIDEWSAPEHEAGFMHDTSVKSALKRATIKQIISNSSLTNPVATIEWINSEESQLHESMKFEYLDEIFDRWSQSDPDKAFDMALMMSLNDDEQGYELTVLESLIKTDLDRAIALLPRVRTGETKAHIYGQISWEMEAHDRILEAIQLGDDLPEHDRDKFRQSLASRVGRRTTLDHLVSGIQQLPTLELKSEAASTAIHMKGLPMSNNFTDSQVDELKQFLTDDDRRRVEIILKYDADDSED